MTPEFSRPERVDTIGDDARVVAITADPDERAALARRFGLVAVERLEATFRLRRVGAGVEAAGTVVADLIQSCAATGEPLGAPVDENVTLRFTAEPMDEDGGEEGRELGEADLDTLPIEGGAIDLGEAAAETMALAIDPFARAPGAGDALRAAGVLEEGETGPFAALKALKDRLEG